MTLAKIVYASMTGNTEEIADIVAEALENLAIEVDINECTQVDADEFEEADICIVATYTYGDGELPDEIVDFYEDLQELDLSGKTFGVCGSGDTFYDDFANLSMILKQLLPRPVLSKEQKASKLIWLPKKKTFKT